MQGLNDRQASWNVRLDPSMLSDSVERMTPKRFKTFLNQNFTLYLLILFSDCKFFQSVQGPLFQRHQSQRKLYKKSPKRTPKIINVSNI